LEIISTQGLRKRYGNVEALRGLDLVVEEGIFGFVGPNGSGKTTTIKLLLGALRPDGGEAQVLGFDCFRESLEVRRRVGVLHEKADYPKEMSGSEYLVFVGSLHGLGKGETRERARGLLESLKLGDSAERPLGGYSAGMRQRLGLAQALIGDPRLVMLDEPTANLDPLGQAELLETIRELHREKGVSFVIASHVLPELQKVCDQVGVIARGVMLEQGSVADLTKKYAGNTFKITISKPDVLAEELRKSGLVEEVSLREGSLWVKASEPDKLYDQVSRIVRRKRLHLQVFQQAILDFEELFMSLLGEEGRGATQQ
jgi:ABC-2 type transport system ATP-binding protein